MNEEFQAQSELQRQQVEGEAMVNAPYINQQASVVQAAIVEQTNPNKVLEEVELKLKGLERRYDGSIVKRGDPIMNDMGINRILFLLGSVVNQNTILSHLEDTEISKMIIQVADDITDDLALNWKEYGVIDKILLDYIVDGVILPSFMSLKRAWKQNEKNWLNRTVIENVSSSPRVGQKKENFMSRFKL